MRVFNKFKVKFKLSSFEYNLGDEALDNSGSDQVACEDEQNNDDEKCSESVLNFEAGNEGIYNYFFLNKFVAI